MKKSLILALFSIFFFASCNNEPEQEPELPKSDISFMAEIGELKTKVSNSGFEQNDAISVYAEKQTSAPYAENVKYIYTSNKFTSSTPITCDELTGDLVYTAVYPYANINKNGVLYYSASKNQSKAINYFSSDMLLAQTAPNSEVTPKLSFNHAMSVIEINLKSLGMSTDDAEIVVNAAREVAVNVLSSEYSEVSAAEEIIPFEYTEDCFRAVVVPQNIASGATLAAVTVNGESYDWVLDAAVVLEAGYKYKCDVSIKNGEVTFENDIYKWGEGGELGGSVVGGEEEDDSFMPMKPVVGGTFLMGNEFYGFTDELPQHYVTVNSFYLGTYEVTQGQWMKIMGENNSYNNSSSLHPVEKISWAEAIEFCNKLSEIEGYDPVYTIKGINVTPDHTKNGYRLPTEAEWEYAARGGEESNRYKFIGSNDVEDIGWYRDNATKTSEVGMKRPNELGFYDMGGNVREWCWDWYSDVYYDDCPSVDPMGPEASAGLTEPMHIARGGNYVSYYDALYPGSRGVDYLEGTRTTGLRVARTM